MWVKEVTINAFKVRIKVKQYIQLLLFNFLADDKKDMAEETREIALGPTRELWTTN